MFLLVGLGNIGKEYELTRHNLGFMMIDNLVDNYQLNPDGIKLNNEVFSGNIEGQKVILAKPQKYMNLSGDPVQKLINFYKIPIENIIIFHDEIDLNLGKVKVKTGGGNAGHNGLKDISRALGTNNYTRVRMGVDRPENKSHPVSNYVLSKWSDQKDIKIVKTMLNHISENISLIIKGDFEEFVKKA